MPFGALGENMITKLMNVQKSLIVKKDKTKSGIQFMYRTAEDILEAAKSLCIKEGLLLTVTDKIIDCCGSPYLQSTATVTDGVKSISCDGLAKEPVKLMSMSAPQITGSCSSYARKTALGGLFALDNNEDPDSKDNSVNKRSNDNINLKQQIFNCLNLPNVPAADKAQWINDFKSGAKEVTQETLNGLVSMYGAK